MTRTAGFRMSALLCALLTATAMAQTAAPGATGAAPSANANVNATAKGTQLARADVAFLKQAAQNGHAEVESSKLALTKATHTQVRGFAQQMVDDHGRAGEELNRLASSKGVRLPTGPSVVQKAKLKLLQTADGARFDKRYADQWGVVAHQDTVKLFEKAAANAQDAEVKDFAAKALPKLQEHLKAAHELKAVIDKQADAKADTVSTKPASKS